MAPTYCYVAALTNTASQAPGSSPAATWIWEKATLRVLNARRWRRRVLLFGPRN